MRSSQRMLTCHGTENFKGNHAIDRFGHNEQLTVIKLFVAKIDDGRYTTIMFPKYGLRNLRQNGKNRTQKILRCAMISVRYAEFPVNIIQFDMILVGDHIAKLHLITDDNGIFSARNPVSTETCDASSIIT